MTSFSASETSRRTSTQLRQLQTHLAGNKMLHASGEFDDQSYKAASDAIDTGLVRSMAERKDVESIYNYLSKPDGASAATVQVPAPSPIPTTTPIAQAPVRDQPVILHVRET